MKYVKNETSKTITYLLRFLFSKREKMKRKFLFPFKNIPPSKISLVVDNDEFETIIVKKEINFQDNIKVLIKCMMY